MIPPEKNDYNKTHKISTKPVAPSRLGQLQHCHTLIFY